MFEEDQGGKPELIRVNHLTSFRGYILKVLIQGKQIFEDDLKGQVLPPDFMMAAKKQELDHFDGKVVWEKCPLDEARRMTGKVPITFRWVSANTGDHANRTRALDQLHDR